MNTTILAVISLAGLPLLATAGAYLRARHHHVAPADAVLESPRWSVAFTSVGAVSMYAMVIFAMSLHPPKNFFDCLGYLGILLPTAIVASVVCNKRLAIVGKKLIDVSFTGRRSELMLMNPVRFHRVPFGWRLRSGAQSAFVPGYWLMGETESIRREIDAFKELLMARADLVVNSDETGRIL